MSVRKELYKIVHGAKIWYFTSAAKKVTHDGIAYLPVKGLQRGNILDENIDKCDTEITLPHPMPLLNAQLDDLVAVFDRKIFYGDVFVTVLELKDEQTLVIFKGRVGVPEFDHQEHTLMLPCYTGEFDLNREICTPVYQSPCQHKLYGRMCGLRFESWAFKVRITAINDLVINFSMIDSNRSIELEYLTSGLLFKDGLFTSISEHSALNKIRLYAQHVGLSVGDIVDLAPGCDQTLTMCHNRFANNLRHGGCPNVPNVNPVGRSIM
jgi:hypothetical protein